MRIVNFDPALVATLPATFELLKSANLMAHPGVSRITLHGSRGLAGGYRPTSDIDLSLIIDALPQPTQTDMEAVLLDVLETTRNHWQSTVELDLAVIFDKKHCGLKCFDQNAWDADLCTIGGVDCFGLYKVGKGFNGLVANAGVQVKMMYPCLKIWQKG